MKLDQFSSPTEPFIVRAGQFLLKNRWLVPVVGVLTVFLIQAIEYWPALLKVDNHFWVELAIVGIIGPFIIWFLLGKLQRVLALEADVEQLQAEATQAERQRIARDLHDKLAQNLGYLHLKLDQMATFGEATPSGIAAIRADLEQMREIANEAYVQVRGTLADLREKPSKPKTPADLLARQANVVAQRAGFEVSLDYQPAAGDVCPIAAAAIIDIAAEALTNAGKHAEANSVTVTVSATATEARITIADDGRGFDTARQVAEGHYGLAMMRERATEIGGELIIDSQPGRGTTLNARFPNVVIPQPLLNKCEQAQCLKSERCSHENSAG